MEKYQKTYQWLQSNLDKLKDYPDLEKMYKNTFLSTLETTTKLLEDGTTYVFTGDIPAMWLRDSSAQVRHYVHLAKIDPDMDRLIKGLIERQFKYINYDPYANAFIEKENSEIGHIGDLPKIKPLVWERKFELDSLCYPLWILDLYYKETNNHEIFSEEVHKGFEVILETFEKELDHDKKSDYWFLRPEAPESESPANKGHGLATNRKANLVWSAFRPSDDVCEYNYFIPGNQFVVLALKIIAKYTNSKKIRRKAMRLSKKIDKAIYKYGLYDHPKYGKIFSFETDGYNNYNLMDDANIPSLLALPYLGYLDIDDEIYQNTRNFILSKDNPYYYEGKFAKGIGSPHTPDRYIWHISLIAEGLTTNSISEKRRVLKLLLNTHAGTFLMHEGFDVDNPANFTREWFSWANSLFAYFIGENIDIIDELMK